RPIVRELLLVFFFARSKTDCSRVIAQRIQPHVDNVFGIIWYRDTPFDGSAADGKVVQPRAQEGHHLVAARLRTNHTRVFRVELQQLFGKGGKLEVVIFFADGLCGAATLGAGRASAQRIHVQFIEDAVLPRVLAFVYATIFFQQAKHLLHAALVAFVGGADEVVIADLHALPQLLVLGGDLVHQLF